MRGETAAEALNDALDYGRDALRGRADRQRRRCSAPSRTTSSQLIARPGRDDRAALGRNERGSAGRSITNFNTTMARSPARTPTCGASIRAAGADARDRRPRAREPQRRASRRRARSLARSCPASARRRRRSRPACRGSRRRARCSARPSCGGLAAELRPATARLAQVAAQSLDAAARRSTSSSRCFTEVILPTGDIEDRGRRRTSTGVAELQGVLVHDGRPQRRGAELRRQRQLRARQRRRRRRRSRPAAAAAAGATAVRQRDRAAAGHAPGLRRQAPPYKPDVALLHAAAPDLNGPRPPAAPRRRAPRPAAAAADDGSRERPVSRRSASTRATSRRSSVIVMIAMVVGGYILSNQRLHLPGWVPVARHRLLRLQGRVRDARRRSRRARARPCTSPACRSARSSKVDLKDGRAIVTMEIRASTRRSTSDATMLLRPEDRPQGHGRRARPRHAAARPSCRRAHDPGRQHAARRQPRRDPRRARRRHARLPAAADRRRRPRALERQRPTDCRPTLRRFEPIERDVAAAQRGCSPSGARTSGALDPQLPAARQRARRKDKRARPRLVDASNACSERFANQDAEPAGVAASCCPARCGRRARRCGKVDKLGDELGPTLRRSCGPGRARSARRSCQTRPFLRRRRRRSCETSCGRSRVRRCRRSGPAPGRARPRRA